MEDTITVQEVLSCGYLFTIDNCSQILSQVSMLKDDSDPSDLLSRSIKSSIILMSFNMLEGYANF
ncbi:MAG: hypothetical protein SOT71_08995, partial [Romboutsia timonensis]|uniref:hypothetical protein n=1 Tax=Romboutsia timonensis TaxID=1776391 RepID=UPI002A75069D